MKELKVLIAPWGDPMGWQKVKYRFGDDEREGWDTVPILADNLGVEDVIFVVSDTLLNSVIGIAKGDGWFLDKLDKKFDSGRKEEIIKQSLKAWNSLSSSLDNGANPEEVYDMIRGMVRNYVETFIEKYVNSSIKSTKLRKRIFVEFGTGRFKYLESIGSPVDFYYSFLADLAKYLISKDVLSHDQLTIYLDTTHGINYFTIMTYKAVRVIASLLANLIDVRVITYNTDPFVPGADVNKALFVSQTENILAEPYTSIYVTKSKNSLSSEEKNLIYFLASVKFMLLLPMLYFVSTESMDNKISTQINDYISNFQFNLNSRLYVNKESRHLKNIELHVKVYLWQQILKKIFKGQTLNSLRNKVTDDGLSLNELEQIVNSIKNPAVHIAKEEIEHIRHVVYKEGEQYIGIRQNADINWVKRNLLAHAGFVLKSPVKPKHNDDPVFKISDTKFFLDTLRYSLLELAKTQ
ncbi:MAG: TIGR01897 family CRISPR-associated protein [Chlorobi bacterium]|nr:TIGR01897 family CRISPR-associated protein [Chlorobiota bacterium]